MHLNTADPHALTIIAGYLLQHCICGTHYATAPRMGLVVYTFATARLIVCIAKPFYASPYQERLSSDVFDLASDHPYGLMSSISPCIRQQPSAGTRSQAAIASCCNAARRPTRSRAPVFCWNTTQARRIRRRRRRGGPLRPHPGHGADHRPPRRRPPPLCWPLRHPGRRTRESPRSHGSLNTSSPSRGSCPVLRERNRLSTDGPVCPQFRHLRPLRP